MLVGLHLQQVQFRLRQVLHQVRLHRRLRQVSTLIPFLSHRHDCLSILQRQQMSAETL